MASMQQPAQGVKQTTTTTKMSSTTSTGTSGQSAAQQQMDPFAYLIEDHKQFRTWISEINSMLNSSGQQIDQVRYCCC